MRKLCIETLGQDNKFDDIVNYFFNEIKKISSVDAEFFLECIKNTEKEPYVESRMSFYSFFDMNVTFSRTTYSEFCVFIINKYGDIIYEGT